METAIVPFVENKLGRTVTNSRAVAEFFGKRHDHVLRDVDTLKFHAPDLGDGFFTEATSPHPTVKGRTIRHFDMTKDGFTLLAMGFTGPKALAFKLAYIARFNEMQEELRNSHRTAYFGQVVAREFSLNGHRLRAFASERGAFVLTADIVPMVYEKARLSSTPSSAYTKELSASEKVMLSPHDVPVFFEGQSNCQFQALSEAAVISLLTPRAASGSGRGGKQQAARKQAVRGWLQSDVFPTLHALEPKQPSTKGPLKTAPEMREQATKLLAAAEALEALDQAKARAAEALGLI